MTKVGKSLKIERWKIFLNDAGRDDSVHRPLQDWLSHPILCSRRRGRGEIVKD